MKDGSNSLEFYAIVCEYYNQNYKGMYGYSGGKIDMGFRTVFSLKSNVKIIDGKGTKDEPYVLGL